MGLYDSYERSLIGRLFSLAILFIKLYLFCNVCYKKGENRSLSLIELLFLVSILIEAMFDGADGMMRRISMNFSIIQCVYIAHIMRNMHISKITPRVVALLVMILFQFYGVGSFGYNGAFITGYYLMF